MLSPTIPLRRRPRSEFEVVNRDDSDQRGRGRPGSSRSTSSKRSRTGDHTPSSGSESPQHVFPNGYGGRPRMTQSNSDDGQEEMEGDSAGDNKYQPGAIVRVKVVNFVTYEKAVFHPGPNLNMVIGPNGTGKSSLVCAICLGLGYGPSHLGRAQKVGEFVKHGKEDATIEVELQRRPAERENHIIRVRITRDGDKRKWWINGSESSLKAVQILTRGLGIQVDNLCQFLPQDRVAEFAGLNPVELLHHTQRAAAPEEMLAWHEQLKSLRKDQKALQLQHETDQEALTNQEGRQENLRADVERLKERAQIQNKIALLEKTVPFVEYAAARDKHYDYKQRNKDAQRRLKELETQVEPTLRAVNEKQQYQDLIDKVVQERRKDVSDAERGADLVLAKVEEVDESITQVTQTRKAEVEVDKKRRQDQQRMQAKLRESEARMQNVPPVFEAEKWNTRIRGKEHRAREVEADLRGIDGQLIELRQRAADRRARIDEAQRELEDLNSQAGQQVNKLRQHSLDTARAWDWVQKNMDQFEKTVYGPPMVECLIKDRRYVDAMESLLQQSDLLTITTQSKTDFKKLSDMIYGTMGLADVNIKCQTGNLEREMQRRPRISVEQMRQFGLDGWASDILDGPEPVIAMLCNTANLHSVAISLVDVSENQYNLILQSRIGAWASGNHIYRTQRRAEYGDSATSTTTRNVRSARLWTDQPVDMSLRREIDDKIKSFTEEFEAIKAEAEPFRTRITELKSERATIQSEIADLKQEKNALQTAAGVYAALPAKIKREQEALQQKEKEGLEIRERVAALVIRWDDLILKKASRALEHKEQVSKLRSCHEACLEAEVRLAEAKSDVEALRERNRGIAQELENERQIVREVEREAKSARDSAAKALEVCKAILADEGDDSPNSEYFREIDAKLTMEELEHDIEAERSKLEFIHDGNSGALKEFELRQITVQKLKDKIEDSGKRLEKLNRKVTDVRQKWEPELDKLVKEISDAFAYNFEQIGCAGEVGVHKDEDFDLWAIEIKVKFRESETLQILDQHRQSGGERSVSTIFYLMSLQSLARAPFRVVDEINQGMDPRNERMVHERMVEIACKEHTSQYFLITPKLLTGLKYDPRMKVLCIASGEYMPGDHSLLDVRRVIQMKGRAIAAAG